MNEGESQQQFASPAEALEHYGVKGQRKGFGTPDRIDRKNGRDPKRLAILYGRRKNKKEPAAVQKKMAEHVNNKLGTINTRYNDEDFSVVNFGDPKSWSQEYRSYHDETLTLAANSNRVAVKDVMGITSTEKRRAYLDDTGSQIEVRDIKIAHAEINDDEVVASFAVSRDPKGLIEMVTALEQDEGDDVIQHYGVRGMKWGVRNDPESGSGGKTGVIDPVSAAYIAIFLALTVKAGIGIVRRAKDSGKKYEKQNANVAWKKKPELSKKAPPADVESIHRSVVKQVNPDFPKPGTKMNCRRCTVAYEMRRRGYDVKATPSHFATGQDSRGMQTATSTLGKKKPESPWGDKAIGGPTFHRLNREQKAQTIFDSLGKDGDGARGEISVGFGLMGGHSMAYEVIRGKPVIFDAQSGKRYENPTAWANDPMSEYTFHAAHTRLDNATLNDQFIRRWAVNA